MLIRLLLSVLIVAGIAVGHSGRSMAQVAGNCGVYAKTNKCQAAWSRTQQQCVCIGK
jgi:hypothetical protein